MLKDGLATKVILVIMVAVRRRPRQVASDHGPHHLVDNSCGVMQIRIVSSDEVAIEDDEIRAIRVKHFFNYLDGVDILLRAPRVPGICKRSVQTM
jgi:hypothetical protein